MDIVCKNLSTVFKDGEREISVFSNLNLTITSGSSAAIVGESGVGKTTLLYMISGLDSPSSGEVTLGEMSIHDSNVPHAEKIAFRGKYLGFIFQFHQLLAEFDALENVCMPLLLQGVPKNIAADRAKYLLNRVGLSHRLTHRPGMLSGGEQQRVAIARSFANSPKILFADEPTGNLDERTGHAVSDLLLELQKEEKITLVMVTHSLDLARRMNSIYELNSRGIFKR